MRDLGVSDLAGWLDGWQFSPSFYLFNSFIFVQAPQKRNKMEIKENKKRNKKKAKEYDLRPPPLHNPGVVQGLCKGCARIFLDKMF